MGLKLCLSKSVLRVRSTINLTFLHLRYIFQSKPERNVMIIPVVISNKECTRLRTLPDREEGQFLGFLNSPAKKTGDDEAQTG